MRKVIFVAAVFALAITPALADFGDLIYSWRAPTISGNRPECLGLAWDGAYVWCSARRFGFGAYIFRCRPFTGSVVSSFENPFGFYETRGMTYRRYQGQETLEMAGWVNNLPFIFWINFKGEVVERKRVYTPGNVSISGIYFDGKNEWVTHAESEDYSAVYKLNDGGSVLTSFKMRSKGSARGIDKQGDFFWVSVDYFGPPYFYGAYKMRPNGSIVATLTGIYYHQYIFDCACENNHLWIVNDDDRIRCVDVSNAPAVAPASVGRVKALFR